MTNEPEDEIEESESVFATESIGYEEAKTEKTGFEENRILLDGESTVCEGDHTIRLFLEGNTTDIRDRIVHAGLDAGLSESELDALSDAVSEIDTDSMEVVASLSSRQAQELAADLGAFAKMIEDDNWQRGP